MSRLSPNRTTLVVAGGILLVTLLLARYFSAPIVLTGQKVIVGYSADGQYLATTDVDGRGHLWDADTGKLRDDVGGQVQGLELPFSFDGKYYVLGPRSKDSFGIFTWSVVETRSSREVLSFLGDRVNEHGFTPDGRRFFSCRVLGEPGYNWEYASAIWDLSSGREVQTIKEERYGAMASAISPDGNLLACVNREVSDDDYNSVSLWDVDNGQKVGTLQPQVDPPARLVAATFSSDKKRLMITVAETMAGMSEMQLFDIETGNQVYKKSIPYYHCVPRFYNDDKLIRLNGPRSGDGEESVWSVEPAKFGVVWGGRLCLP